MSSPVWETRWRGRRYVLDDRGRLRVDVQHESNLEPYELADEEDRP